MNIEKNKFSKTVTQFYLEPLSYRRYHKIDSNGFSHSLRHSRLDKIK